MALTIPAAALAVTEIDIGEGNVNIYADTYQQGTMTFDEAGNSLSVTWGEAQAHDRDIILSGTSARVLPQSVAQMEEEDYWVNVVTIDLGMDEDGNNNDLHLTLEDVTIDGRFSGTVDDSPISIVSGDVTIELDGENTLVAVWGGAGIETAYAETTGSLTIQDETGMKGSLLAVDSANETEYSLAGTRS